MYSLVLSDISLPLCSNFHIVVVHLISSLLHASHIGSGVSCYRRAGKCIAKTQLRLNLITHHSLPASSLGSLVCSLDKDKDYDEPARPKLVHLFKSPGGLTFTFSSGKSNRYLLTLPASLPSSSWNRGLRFSSGKIQSGTIFMKNPFTPLLAASIAAYSSLRVLSEVQ